MQPPTGILQLHAVNGAMLEAYPVSPESRHVQLDISTISSGMYVLKYTDEFQVITKSFIKD
ncbi:MAG: T9SS type A sorting domain-containing protein [Chitinophagales bacterium]|nr:T9SS type A sorting domain-containing protein [Chitinophagales bacterium]